MGGSNGKNSLRRALTKKRREFAALPSTQQKSDAIETEFLLLFDEYRAVTGIDAPLVFCYVGCGWEVPTRGIIDALLRDGARVCVPRCRHVGSCDADMTDEGVMDAVEIASLDDLHQGMYDLWEPDEEAPAADPEQIDLCVIPATAYDRRGARLGRGGGYYDRFLAGLRPDCVTVGLTYDAFLLDDVPTEEYDLPVMHIVTEHGLIL